MNHKGRAWKGGIAILLGLALQVVGANTAHADWLTRAKKFFSEWSQSGAGKRWADRWQQTNNPPIISGEPLTLVFDGQSYRFRPTATDGDGDTLSFNIRNLPNWATFDRQTGALGGLPYREDIGHYSNIAISVSDGQATAELAAFSIEVRASSTESEPEIQIIEPVDGAIYSALESLSLWGQASDAEDGMLSSSIEWRSDQDGLLGQGSELSVSLSPGAHEITAAVADSDNASVTTAVSITIDDSAADLPEPIPETNDWETRSANAILAQRFDYDTVGSLRDSEYGSGGPAADQANTSLEADNKRSGMSAFRADITSDSGTVGSYRQSLSGLSSDSQNVVLREVYLQVSIYTPAYYLDHPFSTGLGDIGTAFSHPKLLILFQPDQSFDIGQLVLTRWRGQDDITMYTVRDDTGVSEHFNTSSPVKYKADGWTTIEVYAKVTTGPDTVRLWAAHTGEEPTLIFEDLDAHLGSGVSSTGPIYSGVQLLPYINQLRTDSSRKDTYVLYDELIVSDRWIPFPGLAGQPDSRSTGSTDSDSDLNSSGTDSGSDTAPDQADDTTTSDSQPETDTTPPANAPSWISSLTPGEWTAVSRNTIKNVMPAIRPAGNQPDSGPIRPWGGGAYDSNRKRLLVHNGGHRDYAGNEIYGFDFTSLMWSRLTDPSPSDENNDETYSDGTPVAVHTYDGLDFSAAKDRLYRCGGSKWVSGGAAYGCWSWNPQGGPQKGWTRMTTVDTGIQTAGFYDADNDALWYRVGSPPRWEGVSTTGSRIGTVNDGNSGMTHFTNPTIEICGNNVLGVQSGAAYATAIDSAARPGSIRQVLSRGELSSASSLSCDGSRFVYFSKDSGRVYTIDPNGWSFVPRGSSVFPVGEGSRNGSRGRFACDWDWGVCVYVDDTGGPVRAFRPDW